MTQQMETKNDCGPVASFNGIKEYLPDFKPTYHEFLCKWGFPNTDNFKDNLHDQPGDHLNILRKLEIPHRRVEIDELLDGKPPERRTIVLLHDEEDPFSNQHWARFLCFYNGNYYFDWGNGKSKAFSREKLYQKFTLAAPDYAYAIGEAERSACARLQNWGWLKLRSAMNTIGRFW